MEELCIEAFSNECSTVSNDSEGICFAPRFSVGAPRRSRSLVVGEGEGGVHRFSALRKTERVVESGLAGFPYCNTRECDRPDCQGVIAIIGGRGGCDGGGCLSRSCFARAG